MWEGGVLHLPLVLFVGLAHAALELLEPFFSAHQLVGLINTLVRGAILQVAGSRCD